jgi:hypothetical protein
MKALVSCPDCGAQPGTIHREGCDVQRCSHCGGQRLQCDCVGHDPQFARWTGIWPCLAEAEHLGVDLNEFAMESLDQVFCVKPHVTENLDKRDILAGLDIKLNKVVEYIDALEQEITLLKNKLRVTTGIGITNAYISLERENYLRALTEALEKPCTPTSMQDSVIVSADWLDSVNKIAEAAKK